MMACALDEYELAARLFRFRKKASFYVSPYGEDANNNTVTVCISTANARDSEADLTGVFSSFDGESDRLWGFDHARFHDRSKSRFCTRVVRRSRIPRLHCVS
jgi:hypothetical protein